MTAPLAPGTVFAYRYRIGAVLGEGGMGAVYAATDMLLNEEVALKLSRLTSSDHATISHLRREVSLARRVTHPHVARVYDIGVSGDDFYMTMERVPGTSLRRRLKQGPMPSDEVWLIGRQIASALSAAHDADVVHLDLKPENVIVKDGVVPRAALIDFGVSRALGDRATGAGTLAYMAPEQLGEGVIGGAADVYALGLLMFEMLTGKRPFDGYGNDAVLARLRHRPPLLQGTVPADLAVVVDGCLATAPGDRPTARVVEKALRLPGRVELDLSIPSVARHGVTDVATLPQDLGLSLARARAMLAVAGDELPALQLIDEVLEAAPGLDIAIATRALALVRAWNNALADDDVADVAAAAAADAVARAAHLPDSHVADAVIADATGNIAYAVRALRRALALDPLHPFAHELLGFLELEGKVASDARLRLALALDPQHIAAGVHLAREHFFVGRDDEAIAILDDLDARRLTRESMLMRMRHCLWRGDRAMAKTLLERIVDDGTPTVAGIRLVLAYVAGERDVHEVRRFLDELLALPTSPKRRAFLNMLFVEVLAAVDIDEAAATLLDAVQLPLADLRWLDDCPALAPLRETPSFSLARATLELRVADAFPDAGVSDSGAGVDVKTITDVTDLPR